MWKSTDVPYAERAHEYVQHVLASCVICEKFQLYISMNTSLHLRSPGTLLPTPKDATEISNLGKPASLKLTRRCSINRQQKIARESENLNKTNNRNVEKILWMETCKPQTTLRTCLGIIHQLPSHGSVQSLRKAPAVLPHTCFPSNLLFVLFDAFHLLCVTFALTYTLHGEIVDRRFVQPSEYMKCCTRIMVIFIIILHHCLCLKSGMSGGWTRQAEHTQKPN